MPVNWEHYLGVDFSRVDSFIARLRDDPGALERIAEGGKRWSEEHYSSKAVMMRLFRLLGLDGGETGSPVFAPHQTEFRDA